MIGNRILGFIAIFSLVFLFACGSNSNHARESGHKQSNEQLQASMHESITHQHPEKQPRTITNKISITAIGDILIHDAIYKDAKTSKGYDFTPMFEQVKPYLNDTTITVANQETMIGGEKLGLSSYPTFNSPYEVGDALKDAGVDVVTLANNHTLDKGEEGINRAINHWEEIGMTYTGAFNSKEDSETIRVVQTDEGIDVSFLSYTYGTNGLSVPDGKEYLVNKIDKQTMKADIKKAKEVSDAVIVSIHFGNQYERLPSQEQKELVQFAADLGVQAVIGHHPHVLQPAAWVTGEDGNRMFVIYSLGNFLAAQEKQELYRKTGGAVQFSIEKTTSGSEETVQVKEPKFLPTYIHFENWRNFEVLPMYQLSNSELESAQTKYEHIKKHMKQWMPELEFIEKK